MKDQLFTIWQNANIPKDRATDTTEYILCMPDTFTPLPGLLPVLKKALRHQNADLVYTDGEDDQQHTIPAYIKPDHSPDLLRSRNYIGSCYAFSRNLAREAAVIPEMGDYERLLRLTEKARHIIHIPRVLYRGHEMPEPHAACIRAVQEHLNRIGLHGHALPGSNSGGCRICYDIQGKPLISIVIPNKDNPDDLQICINSIREKSTWKNWEIILVENNSTSSETFSCYAELLKDPRIRLITYPGSFNYAAIINFGVRFCNGDYILQLNNDTQVITPGWLEEMLMLAQRPDTGAVGAMLYYDDHTIQHAGVVIGNSGVAEHAFRYAPRGSEGYLGRLYAVQDYSAVTGACLMMPRPIWDRLGGMDERFTVTYNDVDLCLRAREAGYRVLFTPWAELYHYESKSRGLDVTGAKQYQSILETNMFIKTHRSYIKHGDPWYMPGMPLF